MKKHMTTGYQGFALLLGALGLVAVACSDDDDDSPDNSAGKGGSTAGKSSGGSSGKGGSSTAGKDSGGDASGGKSGSGTGGTSMAGEGQGGEPASSGSGQGGEPAGGAPGGGGDGAGGDAMGGAGGEGGAAEIVADTLDDGNFSKYGTDWKEEGDVDAATTKWISDNQDGLNHWALGAYSVSTWQTVSPLPNGTYKFSMEVEHGTMADQYLFAKGCTTGADDDIIKESTMSAGSSGLTKFELTVTVATGSCTVGIHSEGPATPEDGNDGWANMDNAAFVAVP